MTLIDFILAPFIFIIKQSFLLSYNLTGNYGVSIILLSFAISLLLLPVFILIEKAKKKDDALKNKMKPLIDEIKRCYKGQERYYYLKTLNRQHHYSPVKALIPILSLLIQIPFFIAAYQFLENYEPLKGVSFLFIRDLSTPDHLLGTINILPIAMTLVNLLTAYFYTKNGNTAERKQMLIVAGIFLVLLFNLPSGLVLYWTMNNVFSFFRLFITNREVFEKHETQKIYQGFNFVQLKSRIIPLLKPLRNTFLVLSIIAILSQFNWAIKHHFENFTIRLTISIAGSLIFTILIGIIILLSNHFKSIISKIEIKPKVYFSLLFLAIYFYGAGQFYFTEVNQNLLLLAIITLIPLQIIGFIYVIRLAKSIKPFLLHLTLFILILVFISQMFNLIVFLDKYEIILSLTNIKINVAESTLSNFIGSGLIFALITVPFYINYFEIKLVKPVKSNWFAYIIAVIYIVGLIFFWNPLLVYSSSPETFDFPAIKIFENNMNLFFQSLLILLIIYLILPKKIKKIWLSIILFFAAISFIYSSIIPINLGSLQESRFSEHEKLAAPIGLYILESGLLIIVFIGIKWALQKQFIKPITHILVILNVFLVGHSFYSITKTGYFFKTGKEELETLNNELPSETISFSKDKQNIVFFLADGFQGWFINQIIKDNPELKDIFEGFIWYPNTLSMANYTHASLPSMLGGYDYSVEKINEDSIHTIEHSMMAASKKFVEKAKSKGYVYSTEFIHYSNFENNIVDNIIVNWKDSWQNLRDSMHLGAFHEIWYKRLYENAIFNSVPLFVKPKIYNNKKWLSHYKKKVHNQYSYKKYNFIRLLPFISNNKSDKPNFIYLHSSVAHNPWNIVTDNGKFINEVTPYKNNEWCLKLLGKWIQWMKDNDVYNNTKIIIISDHGPSWLEYDGDFDIESPVKIDPEDPRKVYDKYFWRLNALLLVKDFNTQGPLKEDWRLMSNADAPAIVFDENNPTKTDSMDRTLTTYWTFWASEMIQNNTMHIHKQFEVTNNVYDLKNWKTIK